jgi:DNA-binding HxlR family transcriptional regulator
MRTKEANCDILKKLLSLGEVSIYKLGKNLKGIIVRATLIKKLKELKKKDLVKLRKEKARGPKGTYYYSLTVKGIFFLILECKLEKDEMFKTLMSLFQSKSLQNVKPIFNMVSVSESEVSEIINKSLYELKSKVNLDYFDQEWAVSLVEEVFMSYFIEFILKGKQYSKKDAEVLLARVNSFVYHQKGKHDLLIWLKAKEGEYRASAFLSNKIADSFKDARQNLRIR